MRFFRLQIRIVVSCKRGRLFRHARVQSLELGAVPGLDGGQRLVGFLAGGRSTSASKSNYILAWLTNQVERAVGEKG